MLIVVRHGRTGHNAAGRLLGHLDPDLDDVGRAQARALAAALGPVDRVVSSPLGRARQTAAEIAGPVEVDERWIEMDYGELDGTPIADVPASTWARWRDDDDFAPPGGESHAALGRRVAAACEALAADAAEHDVVVVSHVSPIKAAATWSLGVPIGVSWRLHVAPASITRIATAGVPRLHGFDDVAHLAGG
ncbi:MAG: histidine phosphatase family protein [Acidimicrobiia bacterium]